MTESEKERQAEYQLAEEMHEAQQDYPKAFMRMQKLETVINKLSNHVNGLGEMVGSLTLEIKELTDAITDTEITSSQDDKQNAK